MQPLVKGFSSRAILFALAAVLPMLLVSSPIIAQDESGPYPVAPRPDSTGVLVELSLGAAQLAEMPEGAEIEPPGKLEVQPLTVVPLSDQPILPDPGPAVPRQLAASLLEPLVETPFSVQQPQASPDLIVVDIWSTTNPVQAGTEENVTFHVKNQGTADITTTFWIRLLIDGVTKATWTSGGVNAGQLLEGLATLIVDSPGSHIMKIEVDFDNRIAESNESNNSREEDWAFGTSPLDLIVVDIWSTTNPLRAFETENVTFQIQNQGTADISQTFYIRFRLDGVVKAAWTSGGLAAGQVAQASTPVVLNSSGDHELTIEVDADYRIAEYNESNNTRAEIWPWGASQADLIVEDIWSTTNPLQTANIENITFSIRNNGPAGVPVTFRAQLWIDGAKSGFRTIPGLAAWAVTTHSVTVIVGAPGNHEVRVTVDSNAVVPEIIEGNNDHFEVWTWTGDPHFSQFVPVVLR